MWPKIHSGKRPLHLNTGLLWKIVKSIQESVAFFIKLWSPIEPYTCFHPISAGILSWLPHAQYCLVRLTSGSFWSQLVIRLPTTLFCLCPFSGKACALLHKTSVLWILAQVFYFSLEKSNWHNLLFFGNKYESCEYWHRTDKRTVGSRWLCSRFQSYANLLH